MDDLIKILAGTADMDIVYLIDGEVKSVDLGERTCKVTCVTGKAQNEIEVRLMSSVGDGVLVKPVVGSTVTFIFSRKTEPIIIACSDIDEIYLRGGDLDGLVKVKDLTTKLNNLEKKVNDLILKYNTHTHSGVQSGASTTAVPSATVTGTLMETKQDDIENKKIKHG